jgi:hypothetical protein
MVPWGGGGGETSIPMLYALIYYLSISTLHTLVSPNLQNPQSLTLISPESSIEDTSQVQKGRRHTQQVTITGHPGPPSKRCPPTPASELHRNSCAFLYPPSNLKGRSPLHPHLLQDRQDSFTHMATWKENVILSQGSWFFFFSSFSWVNECQMFSQNVFISSGQPARILFIIAQRPRGHNRFTRRLWSLFVSPILRRCMWWASETALLSI